MSKRSTPWTIQDIPSQEGRIAVITGANSGLGYHTTLGLSERGARVIMACRNLEKGEKARTLIEQSHPAVLPEVWELDLANLSSVEAFAVRYSGRFRKLDLLINNAGLMAIPYHRTRDGFEMQFGVNHLGHFALTARLWPLLLHTPRARIVNVSSAAHHLGKIRYHDIHWERGYRKWRAYGMSKLANLLFTMELTRKLDTGEDGPIAVSAHPGYANTELQAKGFAMRGSRIGAGAFNLVNKLVAQPARMGALPILYAATAGGVLPGAYFGPGGPMRLHGYPVPDRPNSKLVTPQEARRLWELSESLTGLTMA